MNNNRYLLTKNIFTDILREIVDKSNLSVALGQGLAAYNKY